MRLWGPTLEHPVLIRRLFGHLLTDVPQLDDAVVAETEDVDQRHLHVRAYGDLGVNGGFNEDAVEGGFRFAAPTLH